MIGDTLADDTTLGPLNSARQRARVEGFLERRPEHAELVTGGVEPDRPGFFLEPAVIAGLEQDDELIQREIFGPVITVQRFSDEAQAIAWANGTPLRARLVGLDARRRPRAARLEGAALRLRVDQRPHPARLRDAARRLQAVRVRQGPLDVLARGLHGRQARDGEHRRESGPALLGDVSSSRIAARLRLGAARPPDLTPRRAAAPRSSVARALGSCWSSRRKTSVSRGSNWLAGAAPQLGQRLCRGAAPRGSCGCWSSPRRRRRSR